MRWWPLLVGRTQCVAAVVAALCFVVTDSSAIMACNRVEQLFRFPAQTFAHAGRYRLEVMAEQGSNVCELSIVNPRASGLDYAMACQRPGIAPRLGRRISDVTLDGIVLRGHPNELTLTLTGEDDQIVFQALATFPSAPRPRAASCGDLIYVVEPKVRYLASPPGAVAIERLKGAR